MSCLESCLVLSCLVMSCQVTNLEWMNVLNFVEVVGIIARETAVEARLGVCGPTVGQHRVSAHVALADSAIELETIRCNQVDLYREPDLF